MRTPPMFRLAAGLALGLLGAPLAAHAGTIPYPNVGTPNPVTYTFTAAATGDVTAYFAGSGAAYDEQVGMIDETTGFNSGLGLDDHTSSIGETFNMGSVNAGDTLVFYDYVATLNGTVYSVPAMNVPYDSNGTDGHNHVYATSAAAGQISSLIPAGTYVGFEDGTFPGADFNYHDDTFVFTDVSTTTSVPEPVSMALLGVGLAGLGLVRRRRVR
jgi:hypothetical protein